MNFQHFKVPRKTQVMGFPIMVFHDTLILLENKTVVTYISTLIHTLDKQESSLHKHKLSQYVFQRKIVNKIENFCDVSA